MRKLIFPIVILFTIVINDQSISLKEIELLKTIPIKSTQLSSKDNFYLYYSTKMEDPSRKPKKVVE